jgi:hypothetical protein
LLSALGPTYEGEDASPSHLVGSLRLILIDSPLGHLYRPM